MNEWLKEFNNISLGVTLGNRVDTGQQVFQFNEDRFRHTIVIGRTGSGKSNHVLQMEREDVRSGAGLAIIAAHEEDAVYPLNVGARRPDERRVPHRRVEHGVSAAVKSACRGQERSRCRRQGDSRFD